jgi:hypothetical protein
MSSSQLHTVKLTSIQAIFDSLSPWVTSDLKDNSEYRQIDDLVIRHDTKKNRLVIRFISSTLDVVRLFWDSIAKCFRSEYDVSSKTQPESALERQFQQLMTNY